MTYNRFDCPDCDSRGSFRIGRMGANDPSTCEQTCELCAGSGSLSPQDYYDYSVKSMLSARTWYHKYRMSVPTLAGKYHAQSQNWLCEAKKARAELLTEIHSGSNHIGATA